MPDFIHFSPPARPYVNPAYHTSPALRHQRRHLQGHARPHRPLRRRWWGLVFLFWYLVLLLIPWGLILEFAYAPSEEVLNQADVDTNRAWFRGRMQAFEVATAMFSVPVVSGMLERAAVVQTMRTARAGRGAGKRLNGKELLILANRPWASPYKCWDEVGNLYQWNRFVAFAAALVVLVVATPIVRAATIPIDVRTVRISTGGEAQLFTPVVSLAAKIVVSILIGLQATILLSLAIYVWKQPTWTDTLDALATARIGAGLAEKVDMIKRIRPYSWTEAQELGGLDALIGLVEEEELREITRTQLARIGADGNEQRDLGTAAGVGGDGTGMNGQPAAPAVQTPEAEGDEQLDLDIGSVQRSRADNAPSYQAAQPSSTGDGGARAANAGEAQPQVGQEGQPPQYQERIAYPIPPPPSIVPEYLLAVGAHGVVPKKLKKGKPVVRAPAGNL